MSKRSVRHCAPVQGLRVILDSGSQVIPALTIPSNNSFPTASLYPSVLGILLTIIILAQHLPAINDRPAPSLSDPVRDKLLILFWELSQLYIQPPKKQISWNFLSRSICQVDLVRDNWASRYGDGGFCCVRENKNKMSIRFNMDNLKIIGYAEWK